MLLLKQVLSHINYTFPTWTDCALVFIVGLCSYRVGSQLSRSRNSLQHYDEPPHSHVRLIDSMWMAERLPSILKLQKPSRYWSHTTFKCESIWFHRFYWSIDNFTELFNGHKYRHSAAARGRPGKNAPREAPEYNRRRTSWEWFGAGHISKPETLEKRERLVMRMSCPPFPTTYLRVGPAFCDNYSA